MTGHLNLTAADADTPGAEPDKIFHIEIPLVVLNATMESPNQAK